MKEIRIKLKDVPPGGTLTIDETFPKGDVGMTDADIVRLDGDVKVALKASVTDKVLIIKTVIDGVCFSECSRCLEDVRQPFHQESLMDFDVREVKDSVDIAEDLRQEIVADLPPMLLCKESCKGLCPKCGANWNETTCEHQS